MIIAGLDLGKRKSQLCLGTPDGKVLAERRIATTREALEKLVAEHKPTRILVEASTSAAWVARHLEGTVQGLA